MSNDPYEELGGFGALEPRLTTANFDSFVGAGKYGQIDLTLRDTRNMIWKSSVTPNISLVFTPTTNCSSQTIDYKSNGFYRILYKCTLAGLKTITLSVDGSSVIQPNTTINVIPSIPTQATLNSSTPTALTNLTSNS